jgi:hypothetical protein
MFHERIALTKRGFDTAQLFQVGKGRIDRGRAIYLSRSVIVSES